jgi:GNAT superfamily N-acetyltransferase
MIYRRAMGMGATGSAGKVTARPFQPDDEDGVLELLQVAFGQWPRDIDDVTPSEFFRWKHLQGPFGRSVLVVAEADDAVVGFIAYLPWRFRVGERIVTAMRGVDFAVHPAYQRRGASMAMRAAAIFPSDAAFTWSNPNEQSRPGGARWGQSPVEKLPRYVQAQKPLRTAVALSMGRAGTEQISVAAKTAAEVLLDDSQASLLTVRPRAANGRLATVKDLAYLRWRYGRFAEYRAIRSPAHSARGMVIFRVLRRKQFAVTQVCELFVEDGGRRAIGDLLRGVKKAAPTDFLTCSFPSAHDAAVRGFLPFRGKSVLMVYPLQPTMEPDPTRRSSWALSLGDLDLL